jgi:SpoVK/Ycf46/Vps4 family AAA+-type ATPase
MARSDLLVQLVQSGSRGDKVLFKKVVEAIISEEKAKQHTVLANRLEESLNDLSKNGESGHTSFVPSKQENRLIENLLLESIPEVSLADLILQESVKRICDDLIEEHSRVDLLRSYNLEPRNRVLLVGPPGNGKTSLAEALSNSLMIPFLSVRYEGVIGSYLGETSYRLKNIFDYARTTKCVLFFDEFDSIGKERGDIHETGEIKRVVSSLLLQIDRLPSYVIVIAATNHPELLDRAVWRRFQIKMTIPKPNQKQIQMYLNKFQQAYNVAFGYTLSQLSKNLNGFNFSEVKDFCQDILRRNTLSPIGNQKTLRDLRNARKAAISFPSSNRNKSLQTFKRP